MCLTANLHSAKWRWQSALDKAAYSVRQQWVQPHHQHDPLQQHVQVIKINHAVNCTLVAVAATHISVFKHFDVATA